MVQRRTMIKAFPLQDKNGKVWWRQEQPFSDGVNWAAPVKKKFALRSSVGVASFIIQRRNKMAQGVLRRIERATMHTNRAKPEGACVTAVVSEFMLQQKHSRFTTITHIYTFKIFHASDKSFISIFIPYRSHVEIYVQQLMPSVQKTFERTFTDDACQHRSLPSAETESEKRAGRLLQRRNPKRINIICLRQRQGNHFTIFDGVL